MFPSEFIGRLICETSYCHYNLKVLDMPDRTINHIDVFKGLKNGLEWFATITF